MATSNSPLTHPLSKARGLGSGKSGTRHWLFQRITAILMLPLMIWFVYSFLTIMVGASRSMVAEWFASPFNSIGLAALLLAMFYHAKLGLQVVIEDYVQCACAKTALVIALYISTFLLAIISTVAILKLHIMGI
jgi:succinate dehydrogenase / fumarate reductase membrane anchor subunit